MANDRICGKSAPGLICRYGSTYRAPWLKYGWNDFGYVSVTPADSVSRLLAKCPATLSLAKLLLPLIGIFQPAVNLLSISATYASVGLPVATCTDT
jgi:hypothetical protein